MSSRSRIAAVAGASALLVSLMISVGGAQADQLFALSTTSSTVALPAEGATASAQALCPRSTHIVSGGFGTTLSQTHGSAVIDSSTVGRDGWSAAANEFGVGTDTLTSYAECSRAAPPARPETATTTLSIANPVGSATPTCPKNNTTAIAGGFSTTYDGAARAGNIVFESRRDGPGAWRVSAVHALNGGPTDLTAVAYCAHAPDLTERSATVQVSGQNPVAADATCPAGSSAVSGGFSSSTIDMGGLVVPAIPVSSAPADSATWRASAIDPGVGAPFQFTSYAYCVGTR